MFLEQMWLNQNVPVTLKKKDLILLLIVSICASMCTKVEIPMERPDVLDHPGPVVTVVCYPRVLGTCNHPWVL